MARGLQAIQILALLGIAVSCYALYVEHKTAAASVMGQEYEALCDIKWLGVSCSKVFKSKYGKMLSLFGIIPKGHVLDQPNAALGIIFYGCAFILPFLRKIPLGLRVTIMLAASALSCAVSCYLGYVLAVILKDFCIGEFQVGAYLFLFCSGVVVASGKEHNTGQEGIPCTSVGRVYIFLFFLLACLFFLSLSSAHPLFIFVISFVSLVSKIPFLCVCVF